LDPGILIAGRYELHAGGSCAIFRIQEAAGIRVSQPLAFSAHLSNSPASTGPFYEHTDLGGEPRMKRLAKPFK
jgi:hypothetical protein